MNEQEAMEKANPYYISDNIGLNRYQGFKEGWKACSEYKNKEIARLREALERIREHDYIDSFIVNVINNVLDGQGIRPDVKLREALKNLQNLLVCGPIADPVEIIETAYKIVNEALVDTEETKLEWVRDICDSECGLRKRYPVSCDGAECEHLRTVSLEEPNPKTCMWEETEYGWETSCGHGWECKATECPFCFKPVEVQE
jgi:hypothetical protein